MAKNPTHEEKKAANFAKNFGGKKYAKGGLIDKIKKRFSSGGGIPAGNFAYDPNVKEQHFDYEKDPKKLRKLALMGYKRDGTQNVLGRLLGFSETFDTVNHFRKKNYIKNSNTDTAKMIDKSANATDKQWATGLVGSSTVFANYYVPGSGAAVTQGGKAALGGVGGSMDKQDPSLVAAQARLESTPGYKYQDNPAETSNKFLDVSSKISIGGATGLLKKKPKKQNYDPATPDPVVDNSGSNMSGSNSFNNSMSRGGEIKGKGTAKSDSIPAKLPARSFIVPAKNAEEAKELRKKYLDGNSLAKVKGKSGVDVQVSNGEHLFTPREVAILKSKGVDLNKLAPEAREEDKLANGGPVDPETTKLLAQAKKLKDQKLANEKKAEEEKKHAALLSHVDAHQKVMSSQYKALTAAQENLKKAISSGVSVDEAEKNLKKLSQDYNTSWEEHKKMGDDKNYEKSPSGYRYNSGVATPSMTPVKSNVKSTKTINKIASLKPQLNVDPATNEAPNDSIVPSADALGDGEENMSTPAEDAAAQANNTTPVVGDDGKVKNILGKFNSGDALALAQVGAGIAGLKKIGKRPVYGIGADVIEDAEQAKRDAQYGLSPAEKALAERTIDQAQVDAFANINNLSNGNAAVALNHSRSATVDTTNAKLGLMAKDALIKLEKRRYKSGIVNQLENRRRQQFEDKMQGFQQNQAAFADLTNAGVSNFFGNQQYKEAVNQQEKRDKVLGIQ